MIGFGENSHVLPFLYSDTNQFYLGHKKLIMISPAPPKFVKYTLENLFHSFLFEYNYICKLFLSDLKKSSYLNFIYKRNFTRKINKSRIIEKIKGYFSGNDLQNEQMYNFYESWLPIDHKMVKKRIEIYLIMNLFGFFISTLRLT